MLSAHLGKMFDIQALSLAFSRRRRYPEGRTKLACSCFLLSLFSPPPPLELSSKVKELPPPFSTTVSLPSPPQSLTQLPRFCSSRHPVFYLSSLPRVVSTHPPSAPATTTVGALIKQYTVGKTRNYVSTRPVSGW